MSETKPSICPNCQQPAIRTGNEITCEKCDATFLITVKGEKQVKEISPISDLQDRVGKIESHVFAGDEPEPTAAPGDESEPDEPEPDDGPESDEEILGPR